KMHFNRYPSNSQYVQVTKALITKYPFLRDKEGNGYVSMHVMASILKHIQILEEQFQKAKPDKVIVEDKMIKTFSYRRKEISDGLSAGKITEKYPFFSTPTMDRLQHTGDIFRRFQGRFENLVTNVLRLAQDKLIEYKAYEAKVEVLGDDLQEMNYRAALILLPTIMREKTENSITLGKNEQATPYPSMQMPKITEWSSVFSKSNAVVLVKMDGVEICRANSVEGGVVSTFCSYFVYDVSYPSHLKNTMTTTFLQRYELLTSLIKFNFHQQCLSKHVTIAQNVHAVLIHWLN
ncbi:hypothetical protein HHUSO_G29583, partial [Huso huso]